MCFSLLRPLPSLSRIPYRSFDVVSVWHDHDADTMHYQLTADVDLIWLASFSKLRFGSYIGTQ
jgi:hypothetical protein